MSNPVWLITGASTGLGLSLCMRVLRAGHTVIGSVRSKTKSAASVQKIEQAGGSVIEMDMTEPKDSITQKIQALGRIDYLVNNAGYSILAPCEDISFVIPSYLPLPILTAVQEQRCNPTNEHQLLWPSLRHAGRPSRHASPKVRHNHQRIKRRRSRSQASMCALLCFQSRTRGYIRGPSHRSCSTWHQHSNCRTWRLPHRLCQRGMWPAFHDELH